MRLAAAVLLLPKLALNPFISGPLLLALLTSPETIQRLLAERLSISAGESQLGTAKKVLRILLAIGSVSYANGLLNTMATNAGRLRGAKGWDWQQEVAVVTGGCSGIGLETVKRLADRNVKVAVLDVQELPASLERRRSIHYFRCDITSPEEVAKVAQSITEILGHPSILVNNAGIARPSRILDTPRRDLQRVFEINTMSHWTTVQQFLPQMIAENKGHVVTVASLGSFLTLPHITDYCATKASARAFHEGLAFELRHLYKATGVMTSIVHPDLVRTPLGDAVRDRVVGEETNMLTPQDVAGEIVGAVFGRMSSDIVVPRSLSPAAGIRAWPLWLQQAILARIGKAV